MMIDRSAPVTPERAAFGNLVEARPALLTRLPEPHGLRSRLARPRLPSDYVARPRLLRLLDRGLDRRLTLLSAPAGFGKTTLLSAWTPDGCTVIWLGLDESDADLGVFVRVLISALQAVMPEVGAGTLGLLNLADLPSPGILAARLADDLADFACELVIVLDDYHTVRSEPIHAFIGRLLALLADTVHLVISAREDPCLPISTLRARAGLVEIRLEQLAFTAEEARVFFENALPGVMTDGTADQFTARTEGWPAGLRLTALAMTDVGENVVVPADLERRGAEYAREFLVDDVLATQPTEIQALLLRISILDRFCAPLLDAIHADPDGPSRGEEWLEALKRANLFITGVDAGGVWCRFHPLFRDALRRRLTARHGDECRAALHRKASNWFASQSLVREAINHALAAGDTDLAAHLLEENLQPLLDREEDPSVLEDWLRLLPPEAADNCPALLLARAWLHLLRNRPGELRPILERVERLLDEDTTRSAATREAMRGVADVHWSYLWNLAPDVERLLASTEAAIQRVPTDWSAIRGHAENRRAAALAMAGRSDEARAWLDTRRFSATHADASRLSLVLRAEARLNFLDLRFGELARVARDMVTLGQAHALHTTVTWGHVFGGIAHYAWNELDDARSHYLAATTNRAYADAGVALDSVLGLAITQQASGDEDGALETLYESAVLLRDSQSEGPLRILRSLQARLALVTGDLDEAGRQLRLFRDDGPLTFPSFVEVPVVTRARWLLLQGTRTSLDDVATLVEGMRAFAVQRPHPLSVMTASAVEALLLQARGDVEGALPLLQQAVDLARRGEVLRWFVDFGSPMQRLLVELERWTTPTDPFLTQILETFPVITGPIEVAAPSRRETHASVVDALTWRELEVLRLLDARMSNKEIARLLHISSETVKKHTGNIYQKLQVGSRREAVSRAHGLGLLRIVSRTQEAEA